MPASSSSLSLDEFTAFVAAALTYHDITVSGMVGGNNHMYCSADGQERPQTALITPVKRPRFLSWCSRKQKFDHFSSSNSRFCGSTSESPVDFPHKSIARTSLLTISCDKPLTTQMTTYTTEPTVLAASMSTVDLGNCLGIGSGVCGSYPGTGLNTRNSASFVSNGDMDCTTTFNANTNAIATPALPIFTLEVEGNAGSGSHEAIVSDPKVIDLGSTLRLPRTPSPLFRKSAPDLRIQDPPRSQLQQPGSPRTPRKSFFSKLKEQLSSKASSDLRSNRDSLTMSTSPAAVPNSNHARPEDSPTGFRLHLSLPLTPLSLSTSASPNPSRSPSPRFPFRALSTSYKRESAPQMSKVVLENLPSSGNGSPILSLNDGPYSRSADEGKRRIHSLHDYNFGLMISSQDSSPSVGKVGKDLQGQSPKHDVHNRSRSILSLTDCLVGQLGKSQTNQVPRRYASQNADANTRVTTIGRSSQPFPILTQPDADDMLSVTSRYSCESAPRGAKVPSRTRNMPSIEIHTVVNANAVGGPESEPRSRPQSPPLLSLSNHHASNPEEESSSYAPFVPFVFQHERLQQKLQKSVPLASFEGASSEDVCLKSVYLKPLPPRTSSLLSTHVRKRTKSAPNTLHNKKLTSLQHNSVVPPIPTLIPEQPTALTTLRNQSESVSQTFTTSSNRGTKVERPTTAPANSTPFKAQGAGTIPFPVVNETEVELVGKDDADLERRRTISKPRKSKLKKSLLPLQASASTPLSGPSSPLQGTGNANTHFNLHKDGLSGSRTESVGLNYSFSLGKHPYAQARSPEGMPSSPEESDAKAEAKLISKPFVTFVSSTRDGESTQLHSQAKTQTRFKVARHLMPPSPTSPTSNSGSGSGSETSTKSPVTPRSPLFWTLGGTAGIVGSVKSRIGLGIVDSTPTCGVGEGYNSAERKGLLDSALNLDTKKQYTPPRPYRSQSMSPSSMEQGICAIDASTESPRNTFDSQFTQGRNVIDITPSLINRRPPMVPSKPPPAGPLPCTPDVTEKKSKSDEYKADDNTPADVPPSPVPSEYIKAFPNSSNRVREDDDHDSISNPRAAPSYAPSQSTESYEHDPEYEALLAANTRANVGELASMRNIGVGRRLMSGFPQPPSCRIDPMSPTTQGKRTKVHSETAWPSVSGEWTLFLGNDGTPPRREDIIADLCSVPMTGIKTLGIRARTKSESALNALGLGHKSPCGMKRARSSTLAPSSSIQAPPPPVPKLVKKKQARNSEDWTLSLPLLPDDGDPIKLTTVEADSSRISDTLAAPVRDAKSEPEMGIFVENDFLNVESNTDDTDDKTVAELQVVDLGFGPDIDSLDFEDDDDSLFDFSADSAPDGTPYGLPTDRLLFNVPRVVSKGSGMECATWGEEADEHVIKKRGRRLSDGLDGLLGMAGVSIRVDVDEDGESVCVVNELCVNADIAEVESEEGSRVEGHVDHSPTDAMKENLARLDALSADLRRFNELLKEGVSTTTVVDLKHARSCGLFPSQEARTEPLRVQQSLDALRDLSINSASTKPTLEAVNDRVKWTERSAILNGPSNVPLSSSPRPSSPPSNPMAVKNRPPLPFAPSSPPNSRPLSRGSALGVGPTGSSGSSRTCRATTIATKPSPLKLGPAIGAIIPDGIVGSGLKVGGNGRVISLSCSSAAAPVVANTQAGSVRVFTKETKERKPAAVIVQAKDDEKEEGNINGAVRLTDSKRNSDLSFVSADSFFTSFTSPSQAPTPPPNRDIPLSEPRRGSRSLDCSSCSTPTATSPPRLRIITSSTSNSTRTHSPVDDVYTPSSSAMPTPLASSFPAVPPLPSTLSSLRDDLKTVSRILSGTWVSRTQSRKDQYSPDLEHSRLFRASDMSARTPEHQTSQALPTNPSLPSALDAERDTESMYSDSFYSARSSFDE